MRRASAVAAAVAGAGVGAAGGLIGLGGAEFRLPLLIGFFANPLRRAIALNLGVSLVTVLAGLGGRLAGGTAAPNVLVPVVMAMMMGGVAGAYLGASWLVGAAGHVLRRAVRGLLAGIGLLMLIETVLPGGAVGLLTDPLAQAVAGIGAGIFIGVVSSLLGVAGGEIIIPTLVLGFGADLKEAGTASLLISVPTVVMGLWRQAASGLRPTAEELTQVVVPMSGGSIVGGLVGGFLVGHVPGSTLKGLLGLVLMWSAARLGREAPPPT
jgi:uncharacterized membrane protein YfcA